MKVDLNSDVGESFGSFRIGNDALIFDEVTSVNLACGFHAGDFSVIDESVRLAKEKGVAVGAHPGYPDIQGFGRREIVYSPREIYQMTIYQLGALQAFCHIHHTHLHHVKPHGALYHATNEEKNAKAFAQAVKDFDHRLILYGLSGGTLVRTGEEIGLTVAHEVFADRTYQPDGTLTPRTKQHAMIKNIDEAVRRVLHMIKCGETTAVDGTAISIKADTICVHGDEREALLFAQRLRASLIHEGVQLQAVGENF